ncbi:MAG TPA: Rieske (2Fe-2S) protein [Candidatus Hydrogenedentes bacterium]|jgi:nitrite reductase/ring-hydroxylating ferredoxin subunit|nr:Rieske (2Fe-2S) protein [Candidatus Hydrogenedentota bacterium]
MQGKMIKAAKVSDFENRCVRSVRILGRHVAIIKNPDSSFRAMEGGCKHQNADLTTGKVSNGIVTCSWHGWQYDIESGACVQGGSASLRPYACRVEGDDILISLQPVDPDASSSSFVPFE